MFCDSDHKEQIALEFNRTNVTPEEIERRRGRTFELYKQEESPSDLSMKTRAFIGTVALFGAAGATVGNTAGNALEGALYMGAFGAITATIVGLSERHNNQS